MADWIPLRRMDRLPWLVLVSLLTILPMGTQLVAQTAKNTSYRNPVLFADYSDPDVIRDGKEYYLVSSTFHFSPGLSILHSRDLVHWKILGHALPRLTMDPAYDVPGQRYASGVWAPALRKHNGLFYLYFPTPTEGIFVTTATSMNGPWSAPVTVLAGPGWEDPCPLWDDDGQAYLVHSKKGAGPLILHRMSADGMRLLDEGKVIVNDPVNLHTLEGPKLYKRNGWYYIFAPMGGVGTGSQAVLRAKNIDGPYEHRIVLTQGDTTVNGPHQGAWVEGTDRRNWFLHFQLRGAHGRIVWLEPMVWKDDWPLMGNVAKDGIVGTPVETGPLPERVPADLGWKPQTSDDFAGATLSPMWEWNHNPDDQRWSLTERRGWLRLHPGAAKGLFDARNTITETMQDESLEVTVKMDVLHLADHDRAGLSALEKGMTGIGVVQEKGGKYLFITQAGKDLDGPALSAASGDLRLRVTVMRDTATYSYSVDGGRHFADLGVPVNLSFSWWKGARPAVFAFNTMADSHGFVDVDEVLYRALP